MHVEIGGLNIAFERVGTGPTVALSELVVLSGPGHVSPVEAPDDVTGELRRFLRSVEQAPG